jgi:hypothetical protein
MNVTQNQFLKIFLLLTISLTINDAYSSTQEQSQNPISINTTHNQDLTKTTNVFSNSHLLCSIEYNPNNKLFLATKTNSDTTRTAITRHFNRIDNEANQTKTTFDKNQQFASHTEFYPSGYRAVSTDPDHKLISTFDPNGQLVIYTEINDDGGYSDTTYNPNNISFEQFDAKNKRIAPVKQINNDQTSLETISKRNLKFVSSFDSNQNLTKYTEIDTNNGDANETTYDQDSITLKQCRANKKQFSYQQIFNNGSLLQKSINADGSSHTTHYDSSTGLQLETQHDQNNNKKFDETYDVHANNRKKYMRAFHKNKTSTAIDYTTNGRQCIREIDANNKITSRRTTTTSLTQAVLAQLKNQTQID